MSKKFLIVAIALITTTSLTACNGKSSSSQSESKTTKTAKKKTSENKVNYYTTDYGDRATETSASIYQTFLNVKLGDVMNEGEGGTSYQKIKKDFNGAPTTNSSSETSGVSTEIGVWQYDEAKVTFTFVNDHVVGANLSGFRWKKPKNKITRSSYQKITSDLDLKDIMKNWGYPDEISQILILGNYETKYTWFSGIDGPIGSSASVTFTNNKITAKSQHGLK